MVTKYRHKIFPEKVYNDLTDLMELLGSLEIHSRMSKGELTFLFKMQLQQVAQNYCRPINEATAYEE